MTGYIVETLVATGWRRSNIVHYRYQDAEHHARDNIADGIARAVRILSFNLNEQPVFQHERDDSQLAGKSQ